MIEERPWGNFEVLYEDAWCKVKRITVNPKHRLSVQSHEFRDEVWVIVSGHATAQINRNRSEYGWFEYSLGVGKILTIDRGHLHRMENKQKDLLVFIETQTGESFEETDIIRYEDDYGRA
jgi:mannose-6-phosphate isomerase-like protein (cupin superfamily)